MAPRQAILDDNVAPAIIPQNPDEDEEATEATEATEARNNKAQRLENELKKLETSYNPISRSTMDK